MGSGAAGALQVPGVLGGAQLALQQHHPHPVLLSPPSPFPCPPCSCVHSPGSCQGAAALGEVCPPDTAAAAAEEPSRFELVAGEAGIAAGEEVSISYGAWPSDVFLLFFGFAPDGNPHDSGEAEPGCVSKLPNLARAAIQLQRSRTALHLLPP